MFVSLFLFLIGASQAKDIFGVGTGFGMLNGKSGLGELKDKSYYYSGIYYEKEFSLKKGIGIVAEPFISYVLRPHDGLCIGVSGVLRYYFKETPLFVEGGLGISYSTLKYPRQASKLLTMPQAGIGFHFTVSGGREVFIIDRFVHMSNASTKSPNGEVNSNLLLVGVTF